MATGRHVGEKDADLTILHLSGRSAILPANASRFVTSFGKTAFVNDQDGRLGAQLLDRIGAHVVADSIDIPGGAGEQALHPIGGRLSHELRNEFLEELIL